MMRVGALAIIVPFLVRTVRLQYGTGLAALVRLVLVVVVENKSAVTVIPEKGSVAAQQPLFGQINGISVHNLDGPFQGTHRRKGPTTAAAALVLDCRQWAGNLLAPVEPGR